ncbi:phage tail tape measure protein [Gluconobacter cerinus]|uniref:phage tail tape measure protein n=1 Tax=Gluconobacter cerinus TaxID=38307 RepID=UPI001B8D7087|nr:phage tail tape measure protein [Gluconobacter cerinus]
MANQGVKVTISAVDRASQTLERINARIAAIQAPVRRTMAAFGRFSNVTGLTRLRSGVMGVTRAGLGMFRGLSQIVPVLGTITGAASLAGIYKLASAWAQAGTNIRTAARNMGMAPSRLMAMQNAARLAGGSGEAMGDALQNLSQTKWEALHGYAPEAATQFKALGISLEELKNASPDQIFERITKRLRQIRDPAARVIAATKIFGSAAQGLMPILQQTEAQYQANIREAERYGLLNQQGVDAAARLQHALTQLNEAVEGFGYSLAQSVEPAIRPVIEQMAEWIAANREWISQDITGYVRQFVGWLKNGGWDKIQSGIKGVYDEALNVVHGLGGWKTAGEIALGAIAAIYAAPVLVGLGLLAASLGPVAAGFAAISAAATAAVIGYETWKSIKDPKEGPENRFATGVRRFLGWDAEPAQKAWQYFRSQGWSPQQASGIVANLDKESAFVSNRPGDFNKKTGQYEAYGLAQWHQPRQDQFKRLYGHDIRQSTDDEQLAFVQWELTKGSYTGAGKALRGARSDREAAAIVSRLYESPRDTDNEASIRGDIAEKWGRKFDALSPGPAVLPPPPSASQAADKTMGGLRVEIDHKNAPPGSSVQVKSTSPGLQVQTVRQHRAMDPLNSAVGN